MQNCPHCSAPLSDDLEKCTFCGQTTLAGVRRKEAERAAATQRAEQHDARALENAKVELATASKWALGGAVLGWLCCMLPVGSVAGIFFGLRARRLAQQHHLPGSTMATASLALSVASLCASVALWIGAGVLTAQERERIAELKGQLGNVAAAQLDETTACALTELALLDEKYEGYSNGSDLQCAGTAVLEQTEQKALLRDVRFSSGSDRVQVFSCLEYRAKWKVQQLRGDEDCSAPPPEPKSKDKKKKR